MHCITAGLLLTKLNTGSRFFTLSELRGRDDDSEFDIRQEITALLNEGLICSAGDRRYKITADIYALRKYALKGAAEEADDCGLAQSEACRFGCGDIVDSVWQTKSNIAKPESGCAEQEEDVEEEINRRRREYLEKRRLELIARMREEVAESEEDDEDDELSEDDDECDADEEAGPSESFPFAGSEDDELHKKICELYEERGKCAPARQYTNSNKFKKTVRARLIALVRTDLKMTRSKAIIKAEGCLCAARDIGSDKAAAVYEKVIFELNTMSDYMFNRLKSQQAD